MDKVVFRSQAHPYLCARSNQLYAISHAISSYKASPGAYYILATCYFFLPWYIPGFDSLCCLKGNWGYNKGGMEWNYCITSISLEFIFSLCGYILTENVALSFFVFIVMESFHWTHKTIYIFGVITMESSSYFERPLITLYLQNPTTGCMTIHLLLQWKFPQTLHHPTQCNETPIHTRCPSFSKLKRTLMFRPINL